MLLSVLIDALANGLIRQIRTYLRVDFARNLPRRFIPAQGVQKYKAFNKEIRKVTRCPSLTLLHFHKNKFISIIDRSCFCTFRVVFVSATCDIKRINRNTEKKTLSIEMTAESPPIVSETLE